MQFVSVKAAAEAASGWGQSGRAHAFRLVIRPRGQQTAVAAATNWGGPSLAAGGCCTPKWHGHAAPQIRDKAPGSESPGAAASPSSYMAPSHPV
jgi:hypothetical protein